MKTRIRIQVVKTQEAVHTGTILAKPSDYQEFVTWLDRALENEGNEVGQIIYEYLTS